MNSPFASQQPFCSPLTIEDGPLPFLAYFVAQMGRFWPYLDLLNLARRFGKRVLYRVFPIFAVILFALYSLRQLLSMGYNGITMGQ